MDALILGLVCALAAVGITVITSFVVLRRSMKEDRLRREALALPSGARCFTGIYGSQTNAVLRRIARHAKAPFISTGLRFTMVVDQHAVSLWRGAEVPHPILQIPTTAIRDVSTGSTGFGNSSFPTIFMGVTVDGRTFDLQVRLANDKGVWNASMDELGECADQIRKYIPLSDGS